MRKAWGLISGLIVFIVWMRIVGNPHVVETAIGLALSVFCGFWVYSKAGGKSKSKGPTGG